MAEITAKMVKQLRDKTGAGIMDCKRALAKAGGDIDQAELNLRKRGIDVARKKAGRKAQEGLIGAYVHPGSKLGVIVEVNCESDFVARTDDFQQLVHDIAMHVAATDPRFIRKEDVDNEVLEKEREVQRARALDAGKPEKIVDKIVEGRMKKFYEEVCLLEQPFVKDNASTVGELITQMVSKLGENILVSRMARFKVGEADA
ncbi:MAG: translation elongation factor Ts [Bryobacterales bacterium]|nr:translation elongation factor Ts [Bryobacterales bacterium]MDE0293243.1 translation elongation factor Ts [Bryobacterales bacterium]MDE0436401.1 translation elongation factor Ts [Bryobacterales bacterium]MYA81017.1 translation elongation factor Ts [Terriglobia bacterium]